MVMKTATKRFIDVKVMNMVTKMIKGEKYCYEKLIHPVRWTDVKVMNIVKKNAKW